MVFVAVLPVVVLYTQAMGSKEWREVNIFLCIYCSLYCCTRHLQFANYEYIYYRTMLNFRHCLSIVWKNRMHQGQPQSRFCQEFHNQLFLWRNAKAEIWSVSFFSEQELLNCYLTSGMFYIILFLNNYCKMVRRFDSHFSCAMKLFAVPVAGWISCDNIYFACWYIMSCRSPCGHLCITNIYYYFICLTGRLAIMFLTPNIA